jgi:hypothetical protein
MNLPCDELSAQKATLVTDREPFCWYAISEEATTFLVEGDDERSREHTAPD